MPTKVTNVDHLRDYLGGVVDRADHHAQNVNRIILAIAGAVIWRKDSDPIEVLVRDGDMKNVLWLKISGQRYALSYNHEQGVIEIRRGTTQGNVMGSFSNAMTNEEVYRIFRSL